MNERIKKLMKQAGFRVFRAQGLKDTVPEDVFFANVRVSDEMKKFTALLIRECERVILAESASVEAGGDVDDAWKMGMECGVYTIKKHFGVEE